MSGNVSSQELYFDNCAFTLVENTLARKRALTVALYSLFVLGYQG